MKYLKIISICFAIMLLCVGKSSAADIYTIVDIDVSGEGQTAKEAKDSALRDGQRTAFTRLLDRITPSSARSSRPELNDDQISELVRGLEVQKEKITSSRYSATLSISFNQALVEKVLGDSGVTYIDQQSVPILIIPVLRENDAVILWEENNSWRDAWNRAFSKSPLINWIIPRGDDVDMAAINAEKISNGTYADDSDGTLKTLAERYKAEHILLADAKYTANGLEVTLEYLGGTTPDKVLRNFTNNNGESETAILERAAFDITKNIERRWKKRSQSNQLTKTKINVNVPVSGLEEWNGILAGLKNLGFIDKIDVKQVSVRYAVVDLQFSDAYEDFINKLQGAGLYLENQDNNLILRRLN